MPVQRLGSVFVPWFVASAIHLSIHILRRNLPVIPISFIILVDSVGLRALSIRLWILPAVLLILLVWLLDLLILPLALLPILLCSMVAMCIMVAVAGFHMGIGLLLLLLRHPLGLAISLHCPRSRITSVIILVLFLGLKLLVLLLIPVVCHLSARKGQARARSSLPFGESSLAIGISWLLEAEPGQWIVADLLTVRFQRVTRRFKNRQHCLEQVSGPTAIASDCLNEYGQPISPSDR